MPACCWPVNRVELKPLQLRDFDQRPVLGLYCRQHRQLIALDKRLRAAGIEVFEADIRPPERYLMERFITAPVRFDGRPDANGTLIDAQLKPDPDYRPPLRWCPSTSRPASGASCTASAWKAAASAGVHAGPGQRRCQPGGFRPALLRRPRRADHCLNQWLARHDPDAIIGWNLVQFDLRLLHEHAKRLNVPLCLGRDARADAPAHGSRSHFFAEAPGG
jgi:DNA polymerase-2